MALFFDRAVLALLGAALLLGGAGPHAPGLDLVLTATGALLLGAVGALHLTGARRLPAIAAAPLLGVLALLGWSGLQQAPLGLAGACGGALRALTCEAAAAADLPAPRALGLGAADARDALSALLLPLGLLLALLGAAPRQRRRAGRVAVAAGAVGAALALGQLATSGAALPWLSGLRTPGAGLFANANHQAMALCLAILLAGWSFRAHAARGGANGASGAAMAAMLFLLLGGLATGARSFALAGPVVLGAGALLLGSRPRRALPVAALLAALLFAGWLWLAPGGGRGLAELARGLDDGRIARLDGLLAMARDAGPWGLGLGSFAFAWPAREPLEAFDGFALNQAHNDLVQWAIEGGWPLVALLVAGAIGLAVAGRAKAGAGGGAAREVAAGGVGLVLLLAFSAIDYPLRTQAIAALAALLVALVLAPAAPPPEPTAPLGGPARWPLRAALALLLVSSVAAAVGAAKIHGARALVQRGAIDRALALDPGQPDALERRALAALSAGRTDDARRAARAALAGRRLFAAASRDLALGEADGERAARAWRAAARLGWSDGATQQVLAERALARGEAAAAALHLDALLRQPLYAPGFLPTVRVLAGEQPALAAALARRLALAPPWRKAVFALEPGDGRDALDGVVALTRALAASPRPASGAERQAALARLVAADRVEEAAALARLAPALADPAQAGPGEWERARRRDPAIGNPFAWTAARRDGVLAQWAPPPAAPTLTLEWDAGDAGILLQRHFASSRRPARIEALIGGVPPGAAVAEWRVRCVGNSGIDWRHDVIPGRQALAPVLPPCPGFVVQLHGVGADRPARLSIAQITVRSDEVSN